MGLFCRFLFCLANNVDPDQMPYYVASDLGLHFLPMTDLWVPGKNGLKKKEWGTQNTVSNKKILTGILGRIRDMISTN